jgi:hypothetical protein
MVEVAFSGLLLDSPEQIFGDARLELREVVQDALQQEQQLVVQARDLS